MDTFTELRQIVQHAIGHDEVIEIHPYDMAELLMRPDFVEVDLLRASVVENGDEKQYVVMAGKVYHQTTAASRTGSAIN
jgi:hypothetical protein